MDKRSVQVLISTDPPRSSLTITDGTLLSLK